MRSCNVSMHQSILLFPQEAFCRSVFNKKKAKLGQMCSLSSLKAGIRKLCLKKIEPKLTNSYGFNQEMIDQRIPSLRIQPGFF